MSNAFIPRIGGVLSADIAVPEHEREARFYARVLSTGENPYWRKDLMNNLGMPVIGLGVRTPAYADLPLQWMPHIQVADVAASAARAVELGGQELMHGKDGDGKSQWAVLLDPNGAAFGIVPVVAASAIPSIEAGTTADGKMHVGSIAWLDLTVANAATTRDFYVQVIGWSAEDVAMKHDGEQYADYNMLAGDGHPLAGVCHARGMNADVPAVWMLYLPVDDLGESLRLVEEEEGKIIKATKGRDGDYASAVVEDPIGVCLALVSI
ncbi:MAG: VOC family protein [Bacteroidota bacterium]